jgi:hypothetical protein
VVNKIQCLILVTFESLIPKIEVHELGDSRHTLSMHYEWYLRFMCEDIQVLLNKSESSDLMELASNFMHRQILKIFRLHEEMIKWRIKCSNSNSYCTPPNTNVIDIEIFYGEIMLHNHH